MSDYEIFSAACELHEPGERQRYLDETCRDDVDLRRRVEMLLRSSEAAGSFLESPAPPLADVIECADRTLPPNVGPPLPTELLESGVLGDFRIVREIGRGGMGVVYEAQQISLGRRVALKVLPLVSNFDKTQLARFKNEARAAASLDHPHVVHVHSVGSERGVHYYAMQYIDGQTVAELIAAERRGNRFDRATEPGEAGETPGVGSQTPGRVSASPAGSGRSSSAGEPASSFVSSDDGPAKLSSGDIDIPPERTAQALIDTASAAARNGSTPTNGQERARIRRVAELAIQAADALEHAHSMGIVHRDVKPSNLMVDADSHLWITDFGLAMVEAEPSITTTGSMLGTLRYMSPKQMRGDRHVLDHRTDIYSLGITLYETLTLRPAFGDSDSQRLIQRILHDEPPRPRRLNSAVPRDLETIVLKAMAKEARDRYPSAGELAADLRRFLVDEPIRARPPGLVERAKKWARRHRTMVTTAAATLALATIIAGGLLWRERSQTLAAFAGEKQQHRIAQQKEAEARRQARAAELARAAEAEARKEAQAEATKAKAVVDLLQEMLVSANPDQMKGAEYTVRQLVDDFSEQIDDRLQSQPEVEAELRSTIGMVYWRLSVNDKAEPHLRAALELRRRIYGNEHEKVAESLLDYAWGAGPRKDPDEELALAREALAIYRKTGSQPEETIRALRVVFHMTRRVERNSHRIGRYRP